MKFQQVEAFKKHLEEALPHHRPMVYALIMEDSYERKWVIHSILSCMNKGELTWEASTYYAQDCDYSTFKEELFTPNLFSKERVMIYEGIEKLKKEEVDDFIPHLKTLEADTLLVLSGSSLKSGSDFYKNLKKELIMLDLSLEKPWDRKDRLIRWGLEYIHQKGKTIDREAIPLLFETKPLDLALFIQEIEKLVTYVGDRKKIEKGDVATLSTKEFSPLGWQVAERVIWGDASPSFQDADASEFYLLLGQMRYQLQLGLSLATALELDQEEEFKNIYPNLKPKIMEKNRGLAKKLTSTYFIQGLHDLFDIETKFRIGGNEPALLLDLFAAKLERRRSHVTN